MLHFSLNDRYQTHLHFRSSFFQPSQVHEESNSGFKRSFFVSVLSHIPPLPNVGNVFHVISINLLHSRV